jgi:DNA polymerase III subunit alpha
MIAPLHAHSMYSSLDGFSTPEEMALRCIELDCGYCGLTDHGLVTGHLAFNKAMTAHGIKPIFGCELYHGIEANPGRSRDQSHLIALAMTDRGLENLWRLVNATASRDHFHNVGRVTWDDLERNCEDIVFTSACPLGLVAKTIVKGDYSVVNRYLETFKDNFYLAIHTYPIDKDFNAEGEEQVNMRIINEAKIEFGQERGVPMSYEDDSHFAFPDQWQYHDKYLAAQTKQSVYTPVAERKMHHPENALCIKDEAMIRKALSYLPEYVVDECLSNAIAIAERADAHLPKIGRHLPVFVPGDCPWLDGVGKELTPEELFIDLVEEGIYNRYGEHPSDAVWARAVYEIETLIKDNIHHYFLMGWDEIQFAKDEGIEVGPGRGSSAGCIVAYALGITDVDPLHYGLIFERFWNSGRTDGFPDIDTDFSQEGRPKVREYLIKRWGEKRVCSIGTVGHMKPKAVVDQFHKWFDISFPDAIALKKIIGKTHDIEIHGHDQIGWNPELEPGKVIYVKDDVGDLIDDWVMAERHADSIVRRRNFIDFCEQVCSRVENYGIHASGIVVSDIDLDGYAPAYLRGGKEKGIPATMFPMSDIEKLGLNKMDVLGLKTLDVLEIWRQEMIAKGIDFEWSGLDKDEYPDEMWDLLGEGFCAGIFQIEDGQAKKYCKEIKPRSVEDLMAIGALNRPGPGEIAQSYIARRQGKEEVVYQHPILEPILNSTYGHFLYQEQVIAYYNALGYTLSESDAIRKILGKKKPEELQAVYKGRGEWKGRSYPEVTAQAGLSRTEADVIWKTLERFASYSFNKSHAAAYGIIGFRTLFAKFYGNPEFYMACIQKAEGEKREKMLPKYISEARNRFNIKVYPPDIRHSRAKTSVDDDDIYFGFSDVKGVGIGGEAIENLRDGGYDVSTPEVFAEQIETANDRFLKWKKEQAEQGEVVGKSLKQQLGTNKIQALLDAGAWGTGGLPLKEIQGLEKELLGVVLSDDTDNIIARNLDRIEGCDDWEALLTPWAKKVEEEAPNAFYYKVCGIVSDIKKTQVRATGAPMGIITMEYEGKEVTFAVFSHKWATDRFLFKPRNVGIFRLRHSGPSEQRDEGYSFEEGWLLK